MIDSPKPNIEISAQIFEDGALPPDTSISHRPINRTIVAPSSAGTSDYEEYRFWGTPGSGLGFVEFKGNVPRGIRESLRTTLEFVSKGVWPVHLLPPPIRYPRQETENEAEQKRAKVEQARTDRLLAAEVSFAGLQAHIREKQELAEDKKQLDYFLKSYEETLPAAKE